MRHFITAAFLGLALSPIAMAGPDPIFDNPGTITQVPTVDAIIFENSGDFNVSTVTTASNIISTALGLTESLLPYATRDTLYFTNSGTMLGIPGFRFDTSTATTRFSAIDVANQGIVIGQDAEAFPDFYSTPTGTTALPQYSQPLPSQVLISATNVNNSGEIGVGNYGLLQIVAKNFTNAFGALAAGGINTGGSALEGGIDPLDTTGRGLQELPYFVNPPYVYDTVWGATNGGMLRVDQLAAQLPGFAPINVGIRGTGIVFINSVNDIRQFASYVDSFTVGPTNTYFEIVLVNTNFADTNISANVEFSDLDLGVEELPQKDVGDLLAPESLVQFSIATTDVLTGGIVTNAIYLIDDGAALTNVSLFDNAGTPFYYDRPDCFEITTTTPIEWDDGFSVPQTPFDPGLIYSQGSFVNNSVPYIAGEMRRADRPQPGNARWLFHRRDQ